VSDYRFPRSRRVLKTAEFDRVFQRRRSQADGVLFVYACENGLEYSRLGLVVSRKVGNSVLRARWKRCIREAFRHLQQDIPPGLDLLVLPRQPAAPTMSRVRQSLQTLAARVARQLS
jgi:ribonuclease P protein component